MAEMAGISKDYFSRIFRSVTGMNYSKWLNMIRLEKAAEHIFGVGARDGDAHRALLGPGFFNDRLKLCRVFLAHDASPSF